MRFLGITFVVAALLAASAAFPQNHHSPKRAAKKPPPAATQKPPTPINPAITFISPNFVPNTLDEVYANLLARPRGEFETSEEFQRRLPEVGDFFAVKLGPLAAFLSYSADKQTYGLDLHLEKEDSTTAFILGHAGDDIFRVLVADEDSTSAGSYVGSNAFGAQRLVTKYVTKKTALWIRSPKGAAYRVSIPLEFAVPIEKAKLLKPNVLLVFQPLKTP